MLNATKKNRSTVSSSIRLNTVKIVVRTALLVSQPQMESVAIYENTNESGSASSSAASARNQSPSSIAAAENACTA